MNEFRQEFSASRFDDCIIGYAIESMKAGFDKSTDIKRTLSEFYEVELFPIGTAHLSPPIEELFELDIDGYRENFYQLISEAREYAGIEALSNEKLLRLSSLFWKEFEKPRIYTNFNKNGWNPMTSFSKDSFICVLDDNKIGFILSFDDE